MTRLLALLAFFASAFADSASRFEEWAQRFDMRFEDGKHRNHVFANWISNDRFIEETNAKNLTYTLAHNQLSGMNREEYSAFIARSGKYESKIDAIKCVKACLDEDASNMDKFKCVKACKPEDNEEDVSVEAALVKELGNNFEKLLPEIARLVVPDLSAVDPDRQRLFRETFEETLMLSPSFTLRGGTREIMRGVIARGLGLR